ncbi:hypothetical protein [Sediminivirga luteola]|uniref:hypothetical protein n=1 Tax=Sediminivirga luteola TaxID=1774748 RepID=UPI0016685A5E|nr:hypothetical protein [Sediminivirga luteola]MCI2265921.1 hypothetical protein [Sediminivirga luteola]
MTGTPEPDPAHRSEPESAGQEAAGTGNSVGSHDPEAARAAARAREAYRRLLANRSQDAGDGEDDGDDERIMRERPPHW